MQSEKLPGVKTLVAKNAVPPAARGAEEFLANAVAPTPVVASELSATPRGVANYGGL